MLLEHAGSLQSAEQANRVQAPAGRIEQQVQACALVGLATVARLGQRLDLTRQRVLCQRALRSVGAYERKCLRGLSRLTQVLEQHATEREGRERCLGALRVLA